jgi:hypothetical protein
MCAYIHVHHVACHSILDLVHDEPDAIVTTPSYIYMHACMDSSSTCIFVCVYTYIRMHAYKHIPDISHVCVCVCVCVQFGDEQQRVGMESSLCGGELSDLRIVADP